MHDIPISDLIRGQRDRFRGIITSNTDEREPIAAFTMIGDGTNHGPNTFRGLVRVSARPTTTQIKAAGVDGVSFANGYLRVRE